MTELHYDEDVLIEYLVSPDQIPEKEAIEQHLAACLTCREVADSYLQFSQTLSDPEVWERPDLSAILLQTDKSPLSDLIDYSRMLEDENTAAAESMEMLLALDVEARKDLIDLSPELWTAGFARELCERAHHELDLAPASALNLSTIAIQASEKLSSARYRNTTIYQLQGRAWKENAQALRKLGRYPEALEALDKSEAIYAQATISDFDLATVAFVRASILRDLDRNNEALLLAQKSARVFAQFGHQRRFIHARLMEGAIRYKSGDIRAARDTWMELVRPVQVEHDVHTLAQLFNNIGNCCLELGELDAAGTYLLQAVSIFEDLGIKVDAIHCRWTIGRLMMSSGRTTEALAKLRSIHEDFEQMHMVGEAGLVGLDMVEALLRLGKSDEASLICRYLVERFTNAGMSTNAVTALAYLREALAAGKATPKLASHVRNYLKELPRHREPLFAPPPL
jgi:tetratricopeptide (TPR) repeat protein